MDKGGRPKDPIWAHFWCVKEGKKTMAKCKMCSHIMGGKTDRMKIHFSKCNKKPGVSTNDIIETLESDTDKIEENKHDSTYDTSKISNNSTFERISENNESSTSKRSRESSDSSFKSYKQPKLLQNDLQQFVVKTSSNVKHDLYLQVAKFFYSCNIPFNVAEQEEFLTLIEKLRPGYKPPSRKALSENLLNEVTILLENNMTSALENNECTLIADGWSNIRNESVIASCLHTNGKSYFLNAEECGSNKKTAEYCKSVTEKSIKIAEERYKTKVVAVVTDNENKMHKLRQLLLEERNDMIVYGCTAHWLNLLEQDIAPISITKHVVDIQKYFRNHHQQAAWLKELHDTVKPQLPSEVRWNSHIECISTFIKNRPAYLNICENHENDIDIKIQRLVNDYNLFKQVKDLFQQLQPIAKTLNILQSDDATIADACSEWLKLLHCPELIQHKDLVKKRMDLALEPFHFLACMTDPMHKNQDLLSEAQKEMAREWLIDFLPNSLPLLLAYEAEGEPFPRSFFKTKDVKAKVWWKAVLNKEINPEFIHLMMKLHSIPCSSSSIERIFSNFSHIHSKLRNRLGVQKAAKLVFCYRMLRGSKDINW